MGSVIQHWYRVIYFKKCLDCFRIYCSGFNAQVRKETTAPEPHRIGYLPVIDASPTNLDVVYGMLIRSTETTDEVHDEEDKVLVIIVTDEAFYTRGLKSALPQQWLVLTELSFAWEHAM